MRGREARRGLVLAVALVLTSCGPSHVGRTYGLGRAADATLTSSAHSDNAGWRRPARPATARLPQGEIIYAQRCANCHDTPAFPTALGRSRLASANRSRRNRSAAIGLTPRPSTITFDRAMPPNSRVPLRPAEVYALTAFILCEKWHRRAGGRCSTRVRSRRSACPTARVSLQATVSRIRKPP